ncbi:O-antigen ligase family protein [Mycolicibacterium psychrotolerans]|uniref:O-antigen ligase family protein n=1 Tax=Mycolicibacterium psychrotolerans TaxID=216929 RepID=UPI003D6676FB
MHRRGRLYITCDAAAVLLIVILWVRAIGSLIALSITAEKVFVPIGADPIWPPAANAISKLFYLLAVGMCVGIIIFRINDVTRPGLWRLAVLLAPWLYIIIRNLYSGSWPTPEGVLYVVLVLALAALRPRPRVLIALGVLVVLTAAIAIAFGVLLPDAGRAHLAEGVLSVRPDKEVFPSLGLLQGMFTQENSLGVYLSVGIAAVVLLPRWWLRFPGLAIVAFAIAWSSARNSMFAAACSLLLGAGIWVVAELGWRRVASTVARLATGALLVVMCMVPLTGWLSPGRWDPDAYTGRGVIWNGSLTHWVDRAFLFGGGRDWYSRITKSDTTTLISGAYSGHNQFVQFVATGGTVLAVLALGSLLVQTYVITAPRSRYLVIGAMTVAAIAVSGWLEVPLGYVDWSTNWTVTIVPLAILFLARPEEIPHGSGGP